MVSQILDISSEILCIVQARSDSKRFKNKVLKPISSYFALEYQIHRIARSKLVSNLIVATTELSSDDLLVAKLEKIGVRTFRGSENNVLERFARCAEKFPESRIIIRLTGDCPLIDAGLLDEMLNQFVENKLEYYSTDQTFPDGMDVEIFSKDLLLKAALNATDEYDLEHVTPWIKRNATSISYNSSPINHNDIRVTLDQKEDLEVINEIAKHFQYSFDFDWTQVVDYLNSNPSIKSLNSHISRNEGQNLGKGQKLWIKAKTIIPTGNHLLSKNSEQILPGLWPSYFDKTSGCTVWDLNQNKFIDVSFMGVGTNTLGYNNTYVDSKVIEAIKKGNMSTLNAPEEVYLAEKLLEIHPHFDQVRFARTGGEANAIAIRLARAATGKDKVAICGYHGWHDWYLSTNLRSKSELSSHLLPGLNPSGVPKSLIDTTLAFKYGDTQGFLDLINNNELAAVIMEFARSDEPDIPFIKLIRHETEKRGIVLIFDECSSGFRDQFGGMHLGHNINPDVAMFGKALGNGYAITALTGIESVMKEAENTFISSTFWSERIGFVAGIATLEEMELTESWKTITSIGRNVQKFWHEISDKTELNFKVSGFPAISSFNFENTNNLLYKTFITQEMLKKGFLASNVFYASVAHTEIILDQYFIAFAEVLENLKNLITKDLVMSKLESKICKSGFGRLT